MSRKVSAAEAMRRIGDDPQTLSLAIQLMDHTVHARASSRVTPRDLERVFAELLANFARLLDEDDQAQAVTSKSPACTSQQSSANKRSSKRKASKSNMKGSIGKTMRRLRAGAKKGGKS